MFDIVPRNVANIIHCSICYVSGEDFIKKNTKGLMFSYLKEVAKFSKSL